MGVVHLAHQRSVDRFVALKTLKENDFDDVHKEQLMREGWVLGELEHPNIPPIYTICSHGDSPAIAQKRIEGQLWSRYLRKPETLRQSLAVEDELEWHLGILLKVIDAVRFAHGRGILHRDLKPANVMIGRFGEVYLMDWGLAVSLRAEHEGAVQLARDVFQAEGTSAYMAPEMLDPQLLGISEQTDVYQLGAILYEICMGEPPHAGADWREIQECIRRSQPSFRHGLPTELMMICRRALQAKPQYRFQSANDMRIALERFRRHRGANQLALEGESLLMELEVELLGGGTLLQDANERIAQCRFAFQQSLKAWPENDRAENGLLRCNVAGAELALQCDDPRQALALLETHPESPLKNRCRNALQTKSEAAELAERLRLRSCRQQDSASRRAAIACSALIWVFLPIYLELSLAATTYSSQGASQFAFLSVWLLVGRYGDRWVSSTELNAKSYSMVLVATVLALVVKLGSFKMGLEAEQAQVYDLFIFFTAGLLTTTLIDWRMWPTVVAYFAAFLMGASNPASSLWAMAASNAVLAITAVYVWRRQSERRAVPARLVLAMAPSPPAAL
tara:strand:+ start:302 stop:1999 length:1698 start_codon:yes stop_codon:yes gene_type:complete